MTPRHCSASADDTDQTIELYERQLDEIIRCLKSINGVDNRIIVQSYENNKKHNNINYEKSNKQIEWSVIEDIEDDILAMMDAAKEKKGTGSAMVAFCSQRQMEHLAVTRSLESKPTRDDVNNILHCLFGEVDSFGFTVCRDTHKYRIRLSEFVKHVTKWQGPLTPC
jgi:hypothetical protein